MRHDEERRSGMAQRLLFPPLPEFTQDRQGSPIQLGGTFDPPNLLPIGGPQLGTIMEQAFARFTVPGQSVFRLEFLAQQVGDGLKAGPRCGQ